MVSYFIQLYGMQPNPAHNDRTDNRDRWLPPKKRRSNIQYTLPGQAVPVNLTFYHNGVDTRLVTGEQPASSESPIVHFKTYSLYHARGVFWTIDYDATKGRVGDGKHHDDDESEEERSDEEEGQAYDDWSELSFRAADVEGYSSVSYAGRHFRERRMLAKRRSQEWVRHLIPDRYQSHNRTRNSRSGGLVGELPLLVGLVALSLPVTAWPAILPQTIVNPPSSSPSWRISQYQLDDGDHGWPEERGVVVKIFRDPATTSEAAMSDYEGGSDGPILA